MLDRIAGQIERYMDVLSARQRLVASNIANADTPGYHTRDLDFQAELRKATQGSPPTSCAARSVPCGRRFRKAKADEPFQRDLDRSVGHGGPARPGRGAGGE